jgi:hypothetical protein
MSTAIFFENYMKYSVDDVKISTWQKAKLNCCESISLKWYVILNKHLTYTGKRTLFIFT